MLKQEQETPLVALNGQGQNLRVIGVAGLVQLDEQLRRMCATRYAIQVAGLQDDPAPFRERLVDPRRVERISM